MPSRNRAHGRVFIRWISSCFNPSNHGGGAVISAPMKAAGDMAAVLRRQSNQHSVSSSSLGRIALGDSECCAICLGELIGCAGVKVLQRCGHEFHGECIDEWLPSRSLNCPVCREQAVDDHQKKLIRKPVANGTLHHDPAQAFAINFSSVYLGCFVSVN